jgi:transposase
MFLMKAYSLDLRQRIVESLQQGATKEETATRFCVSLSTVKRYNRQHKQQGTLAPKPLPGRARIIKPEENEEFIALIASKTDWTLASLGEAWHQTKGVKPTISVLSDTCRRLGITRKKRVGWPMKEMKKSERHFERPLV